MIKPVCVFQAPFGIRSGYGQWAETIAHSIIRYDKWDLKLIPTRWGGCSKKGDVNEKDRILQQRFLTQPLPRQPEIFIQCSIPPEFKPQAKYNICITAGIESTIAPANWLEHMNTADLNLVMSNFNVEMFKGLSYTKNYQDGRNEQLSLKKPIEAITWSADTNTFYKCDVKLDSVEEVMSRIPEEFAFLFIGMYTSGGLFNDRKDVGNLIRVFLETFNGLKNKPALIVKTNGATSSNIDKHDMLKRIHEITQIVKNALGDLADLPNVYLLHGDMTDAELNALINHHKVKSHISFTHGEGWGGPLLLGTLTGKPTLAPNWSGQIDFLNDKYCKRLEGALQPIPPESQNEWLVKDGHWFVVDYRQASERMKNLVYHYGSYLEDAEKLRIENMEKFSESAMDKTLHGVFEKYVPKFATEHKLILPKLLKKVDVPKLNIPSNV